MSHYGKDVHTELFLIEDNKGFLSPKDMLKSQSVKTREKDGKDYYHMEPWYRFVDPFKYLKDYKIIKLMRIILPEEVAAREAEQKRKWEEKRTRRQNRKK